MHVCLKTTSRSTAGIPVLLCQYLYHMVILARASTTVKQRWPLGLSALYIRLFQRLVSSSWESALDIRGACCGAEHDAVQKGASTFGCPEWHVTGVIAQGRGTAAGILTKSDIVVCGVRRYYSHAGPYGQLHKYIYLHICFIGSHLELDQ